MRPWGTGTRKTQALSQPKSLPYSGTKSSRSLPVQQAFSPRPGRVYTSSTHDVYDRCMSRIRTNIEIEETYLRMAMERYGLRTKTEAVDLALRRLAGQPMTREEALAMEGAGAVGEPPSDTGPVGR